MSKEEKLFKGEDKPFKGKLTNRNKTSHPKIQPYYIIHDYSTNNNNQTIETPLNDNEAQNNNESSLDQSSPTNSANSANSKRKPRSLFGYIIGGTILSVAAGTALYLKGQSD